MIKLRKCDPNDPETTAALAWLEKRKRAFQEAYPSEKQTPYLSDYREDRVKAALRKETNDKCAYCEWKYASGAWGDVEHIRPKAHDIRNRLLDYGNLTLACSKCNNAKSDYEDPEDPILDPYADEPEKHLQSFGHYLQMRNGSKLGYTTILVVGLNRRELLASRAEVLERLIALRDSYHLAKNPVIKQRLRDAIEAIRLDDGQEFALMARDYFKDSIK